MYFSIHRATRASLLATLCTSLGCASPTVTPDAGSATRDVVPLDAETSDTHQDSAVTVATDAQSDGSASNTCHGLSPLYPAGATTTRQLSHGGMTRTFRVHVPPGYDGASPRPLVLMFHGGGGNAQQFEDTSAQMDPIADREGFITVYPNGTGRVTTWNAGTCCGASVTDTIDDVGFVRAVLDDIATALCVDRRRVFAAGMSNGAMLTHRLGCELSDRIAAIAPVAGTDMTTVCSPTRPVAVFEVHGTMDGHVPWAGGTGCGPSQASFTSVPETLARWQARDHCTGTATQYFSQGNGRCVTNGQCAHGSAVVLCTIDGGGHSWPGGVAHPERLPCPANGPQSSTFIASEAIWQFFAAHPMPTD